MGGLLLSLCIAVVAAANMVGIESIGRVEKFLARVETAKWHEPWAKNPPARIKRDNDGKIIELRLDGMQLSDSDFDVLVGLVDLHDVNLSYTNISDAQVTTLSRLPKLESLKLNRTEIGDAGVKALAELPNLKVLCLGGVRASREAVKELQKAKPNLSLGYFPFQRDDK